MNSLHNRIRRLETATPTAGNLVIANAPSGWTEEQCRAALGAPFTGADYKLDLGHAPNIKELTVIFAGTHQELDTLMDEIARKGRRITDPHKFRAGE